MSRTPISRKLCGIYKFTEKTTNQSYIGQSKDIIKRIEQHYTYPMNEWEQRLVNDPSSFTVEIVELCEEENLNACEAKYITKFNTYKNGLNKTPGNINSMERFYEEKILKELSKPTARKSLEQLIKENTDKNDKPELLDIQKIVLERHFTKPNGELMLYLFYIQLKNKRIPVSIFLTHEEVPMRIMHLLRTEYKDYRWNTIKPYCNGYMLDTWNRQFY